MNKILVVVDMQNDFIDGVLGTDEAKKIVPLVADKICNWDGPVVCTMDIHSEDDPEFKLYPKHCVEKTDGCKCNNEIKQALTIKSLGEDEEKNPVIVFDKNTFGCDKIMFVDLYLADGENDKIEDIEFVGLCTDLCVISNVLMFKAFEPAVNISVDASCCAGTNPEMHDMALRIMKGHGVDILNYEFDKTDNKLRLEFEPINMIDTPEDFYDLVRGK